MFKLSWRIYHQQVALSVRVKPKCHTLNQGLQDVLNADDENDLPDGNSEYYGQHLFFFL